LIGLTALLVRRGITDIKLTGGDRMLRKDIVEIVRGIKAIPGLKSLHLVTRHHLAGELAGALFEAGLDVLNFSLDSLDESTWESITRVKGHRELIEAVYKVCEQGCLMVRHRQVGSVGSLVR
jgi:cyclic pyranopterin phosphate synthase